MTDDERWADIEARVLRKLRSRRVDILADAEIKSFTLTTWFGPVHLRRGVAPPRARIAPSVHRVTYAKECGDLEDAAPGT